MTMLRILLLLCFASYAVVDSALIGGPRVIYDGTVGEDGETINMNHELFDKIKNEVVFHFNRVYFTAKSCSGKCNPDVYHTIFHVKKITSQVVAGVKYGVDFSLLPTKCHTSNTTRKLKTLSECRPVVGQVPQLCHAEIWEKAWLRMFKTTNMTCVPEILLLHRSVRSVSSHRHAVEVGSYSEFLAFKATHGKIYTPVEQLKRFRIFRENMQKAHVLTQLELGSGRYGASPYADMTETEFRSTRLAPIWDQSKMPETPAKPATQAAPTAFDWRQHNAVTPVKNQGSCGSCWAFSTTGNVEGQWAIHKKKLLSLSEQELVDCDKVDQGCGGGLPSNAYKAIMKLGGLELESEYPYEGRNDKCKFDKADVRATVNGSVALPQDEGKLAAWLAQNGPISIGINAFAMQFYMGGISHPWSFLCNPAHLDHGVLLVGYGVKGTEPYWIVKNSWGPSWGEQGYYLVYRGGGVCGLNRMATSAVVN